MTAKVGDRVGAILKANEDTVWLFGYGTYEGQAVPDESLGVKDFAGGPMTHLNYCLKLDSGKLVFGCECWWGPEEYIKSLVTSCRVVIVADIEEERNKRNKLN